MGLRTTTGQQVFELDCRMRAASAYVWPCGAGGRGLKWEGGKLKAFRSSYRDGVQSTVLDSTPDAQKGKRLHDTGCCVARSVEGTLRGIGRARVRRCRGSTLNSSTINRRKASLMVYCDMAWCYRVAEALTSDGAIVRRPRTI
jgi:hypothetical protein